MPVVTRRRGVRVLVVVAAAFPLLLAGGAALLTVVIGGSCTGSGIGDAPSALAIRDIPASFLRIYEQVGAQFKIPWEVLAGIGKEECDHGRDPDPSCTPQPGARGPGVANCCGASGPMQIGIGGASTDNYDKLRHYLPDPSLGPHDPTTAVELAALYLIKLAGAPTGQPIDAYRAAILDYNHDPAVRRPGAGRRARLSGRRARGVRPLVQRCVGHAAGARDDGEDPAERRRGRPGGRPGCRAGDDRGR